MALLSTSSYYIECLVLLYEIESDEFDTPDFADVNLMEKFSHRAKVLQKVIQLMSCTNKEEIGK